MLSAAKYIGVGIACSLLIILSGQRLNNTKNKSDKNKLNLNYSFSLPIILSSLKLEVTDIDSSLTQFSYGVFLLSLIGLICFIQVIGFMLSYFLLQKGNFEIKYSKLSKFINLYKKTSLIFVTIEVLLCFTCLLLLVFFSLLFVYSSISNR